jgi:hypothetical protein
MKESVTYQAILEEGRAEAEKRYLLLLGSQRLGQPDAAMHAALDAIDRSKDPNACWRGCSR